jgi:hypothetical protein
MHNASITCSYIPLEPISATVGASICNINKCFSDVSPEAIHSVVAILMCILLLAMTPKALNMIQLTAEFGINPTHVSLAAGIVAGGHSSLL